VYYANAQFVDRGIRNVFGVTFKKGENPSVAKLDSVRNAKIIYITGGDQNRFMDVVASTEIEQAILTAFKKGSLIAGTSAGAAVMSKIMITGNELKHPDYTSTFKSIEENNIETKAGLGLIEGVIIDQHFLRRSRHNRLFSAVVEFPDQVGIGIDEATAILVKGKKCEVIGASQVLVIRNPSKTKTSKNGKLGARGLTIDIYLPGETFVLK
jgi:cyanophycinase